MKRAPRTRPTKRTPPILYGPDEREIIRVARWRRVCGACWPFLKPTVFAIGALASILTIASWALRDRELAAMKAFLAPTIAQVESLAILTRELVQGLHHADGPLTQHLAAAKGSRRRRNHVVVVAAGGPFAARADSGRADSTSPQIVYQPKVEPWEPKQAVSQPQRDLSPPAAITDLHAGP